MKARLTICAALGLAGPALAQTAPAPVEAPVLTRTVEKGERLTPGDFVLQAMPAASAQRALPVAEAASKEAARRLAAGSAVRAGDVANPQMVRRGDAVMIAVRMGTLSITTSGRALSGGGMGDAIRVLNLSTNRTLDAVVEDTGRVRVNAS